MAPENLGIAVSVEEGGPTIKSESAVPLSWAVLSIPAEVNTFPIARLGVAIVTTTAKDIPESAIALGPDSIARLFNVRVEVAVKRSAEAIPESAVKVPIELFQVATFPTVVVPGPAIPPVLSSGLQIILVPSDLKISPLGQTEFGTE